MVTVHGGLSQFSRQRRYGLWKTVFRRKNGTVPGRPVNGKKESSFQRREGRSSLPGTPQKVLGGKELRLLFLTNIIPPIIFPQGTVRSLLCRPRQAYNDLKREETP